MTEQPHLTETAKTETIHRRYNDAGEVISETVTVVTWRDKPADDRHTGMYL